MSQRYDVSDTELSERFPIYIRADVGEVWSRTGPDPPVTI
jgi:hypothetical protein